MKRSDFESMGDRHKVFESIETSRMLMPGLPFVVRLDGRAFHTFTRGLERPFDVRLRACMCETMMYLVAETNATIGYTQSDEITLVFINKDPERPTLFDGRVQKLSSVIAAMASVRFTHALMTHLPEKLSMMPVFDARVFSYPTLDLVAENLLWRETDATRNSLTMAAHAFYGTKELHKAGFAKKHEMLHAKGVNWNDYPAFFKRGVYARRVTVEKMLTEAELAKIPVKHHPSGPVMRSEVQEIELPPLSKIANKVEVLFFGHPPFMMDLGADEFAAA